MPTVRLLRKASLGLAGTYRNAHHHAKKLLPIIDALVKELPNTSYKEWGQAHNVHTITTVDGRQFIFRPYTTGNQGYTGISLSLKLSRAKSSEIFLFSTTEDETEIKGFVQAVKALSIPKPQINENPSLPV
jgi:hypothetical protein